MTTVQRKQADKQGEVLDAISKRPEIHAQFTKTSFLNAFFETTTNGVI